LAIPDKLQVFFTQSGGTITTAQANKAGVSNERLRLLVSNAICFIESNLSQAKKIAELTDKQVICVETDSYFGFNRSLSPETCPREDV
jgi:hypothetical protein